MKRNPGEEKDLSLRAETSETAAENGRIQEPSPPTVEKVKSLLVVYTCNGIYRHMNRY